MQEYEQLQWIIEGIVLRDVFTKIAKRIEKSVDVEHVVVGVSPDTLRFLVRLSAFCSRCARLAKLVKRYLLAEFKISVQNINQ